LILESSSSAVIIVGRKGSLALQPGFYLYIGSALGPGGLRARVSRHADRDKKKHWHIDYLRPHLCLRAVCFSVCSERLEDVWSEQVGAWPEADVPMKGFGASDRQLGTHLYYFQERPGADSPVSLGGGEIHCLETGEFGD
jgi:Uri superfamily endonuclease